tara:strand:- start:441 stop:1055 length:615 start_codon:yes stop_codon:yes gene_type:complete
MTPKKGDFMNPRKIKLLIASIVLACSNIACAKSSDTDELRIDENLAAYFAGDNFVEEENGGENNEEFRISKDSITQILIRQVGSNNNPEVPYPTVCKYRINGRLMSLFERSPEEVGSYMPYASHELSFQTTSVELLPDANSTDKYLDRCQAMVNKMNSTQPWYSIYFEVLSENRVRFHTSGGGDYESGQPRTESTLDEVYTRLK